MKRLSVAVGLAILVSACNGRSSASIPTAPSPVPGVVPQPTGIQLAGSVSDAAWRPLIGARVEVVDGPQAGLSTTTDGRGEYRLAGTFDDTTHFRATKDGHVAATWPFPSRCTACNPNWWIHFYLEALAPHADIEGSYTLTFIADSACPGLPNEVRTRTYGATVTLESNPNSPANSHFNVTVSDPPFLEHYNSFMIGVAGEYLAAELGNAHGSPGLVEQVAPNTYLTLGGSVAASVTAASTITASFYGFVDQCELTAEWGSRYNCSSGGTIARAQCTSPNHRLILTRR